MKVLTIGGATQDVFLRYKGIDTMTITKKNMSVCYMLFESGEKVEIKDLIIKTGGGATNSSVSFKRLGMKVSCFCKIGDDSAGKTVIKTLTDEGIDTSNIIISSQHATGVSFIVNSVEGDYTIFVHRGANSTLELEKLPFEAIKVCDQLYITSLSNESAKILPSIASFAKKHNIPIAINPGISQLKKGTETLKESLRFIDIFILNKHEAQIFMIALIRKNESYKKILECTELHKNLYSKKNSQFDQPYLLDTPIIYEDIYFSLRNFFKVILKMGPKIVVVTNGKNGVYVATKDEILYHP